MGVCVYEGDPVLIWINSLLSSCRRTEAPTHGAVDLRDPTAVRHPPASSSARWERMMEIMEIMFINAMLSPF